MPIEELLDMDWIPLSIIPDKIKPLFMAWIVGQTLSKRKTYASKRKLEVHWNGEDFREWYAEYLITAATERLQ